MSGLLPGFASDKHRIVLWLVIAMCLGCFAAAAKAASVRQTYRFAAPAITTVEIDGQTYHRLDMPDARGYGDPGQPVLPAAGARLLLPCGTTVERVEILSGAAVSMGVGFRPEPGQYPIPLSVDPEAIRPEPPDPQIYRSRRTFPDHRVEIIGTQRCRGYDVLVLKLLPVEFLPDTGELRYYDELEVVVHTTAATAPSGMLRRRQADADDIADEIDNPAQLASYPVATAAKSADFDLLILTTPGLADAFLPLEQFHDSTGIATEIHTILDPVALNPETVRDYIRNIYLAHGISYVLIGGDDDVFAAPDLYVLAYNTNYVTDLPGDIYFACLDGTYNYDNDDRWAEPTDGEGGGDVDLMAEVYVGRAPAGDVTEASRFVAKTIRYMTNQEPYLDNVLIVGEYVGFGGIADYAANTLDELVDGSTMHNYATVGFPSADYALDFLYDRDWDGNWPKTEVIQRLNSGRAIVNHYGHSNINYSHRMSGGDILTYVNNPEPFILYSQGCLAGHFDGGDCWAEYATVKSDYAAAAVIMNARYGWGGLGTTDGASQRYNREFWDAVFGPVEAKPELGRANQDSKEDNLHRVNEGSMRWCYYELTLFGDPTLAVRKVRTIAFDFPDGLPTILTPDSPAILRVDVRGVGLGVPVPGTCSLWCAVDDAPYQSLPMTEVSPNHYEATLPAVSCGGKIEFYLAANEAVIGNVLSWKPYRPHTVFAGLERSSVFFEDFEIADEGWLAAGLWQRGLPTGQGGNGSAGPDPAAAFSGVNCFGYNLDGNYEDNLPATNLISPPIDCSGVFGVELSFRRWLGVETTPYDHVSIRVSTNGATWTTVWENTSEFYDSGWNRVTFDISAVADDHASVYLCWTMGPTDGGLTYCGWNIDDVEITGLPCLDVLCGDANGDEEVDVGDAVYIINYVFKAGAAPSPLCFADANNDGAVNVGDAVYLINYTFKEGSAPGPACCP